jgi:hypothetical protein
MILDQFIDIHKILLLIISLNVSANEIQINKQEIIQDSGNSIIFSLESNTYENVTYLNPGITYSHSGYNIGISSQNVPVHSSGAQNYESDTYLNLSKVFTISDKFTTTVGAQSGYVIKGPLNKDTLHLYDYLDFKYRPFDKISLHVGPYYVNRNLSTTISYIGFQTGFRIILIQDVIKLNVDYVSGRSNVSGAISQITYKSTIDGLSPYLGVGIPETKSGNEFYGIIGFNYVLGRI